MLTSVPRTATFVAFVLFVAVAAPATADDAEAPPCATGAVVSAPAQKLTFFNEPLTTAEVADSPDVPGAPSTITAGLLSLILQAEQGAFIRIALYQIGETGSLADTLESDLLIEALRTVYEHCNVDIDVITDMANAATPAIDDLDAFAAIHICDEGCFAGDDPLHEMHNKFLTIDDMVWTAAAEKLVVQMTANWTQGSLSEKYWNAMIALWGDAALHDGYRDYWHDMWECRVTGSPPEGCTSSNSDESPSQFPVQGASGTTGASANFFPQSSGDPVLTAIGNVGCSPTDRSLIQVMMSYWGGSRGAAIAGALGSAKKDGCTVQVVLPIDQGAAVDALEAAGLAPHCSADRDEDLDPRFGPAVHSKYMLLNGKYSDDILNQRVFVGSQNFTTFNLKRHDNTWLQVRATSSQFHDNRAVYSAFAANFAKIWASTPECSVIL